MQPIRQSGDQHYSRRTPEKVRRGTESHAAKLSAAQITAIRAAFECGATKTALARQYGVSRITIWRHVKGGM